MRLSCRPDDAGYERYCRLMTGNDLKFFVDGAEVDKVITADDEEGFLLVYVRDLDGKLVLYAGAPIEDRRTGAVRIDIIPRS